MFTFSKRSLSAALAIATVCWVAACNGEPLGSTKDVGLSGVSAQMMFLLDENNVVIMDRAEQNALQVAGHFAWVVKYNYNSNTYEAMDVKTNTFCAGGAMAGDGSYVIGGGTDGQGYGAEDGGFALNMLHPDGGLWEQHQHGMQVNRWYATMETLADGSIIIVGGQHAGGYVPTKDTNEPNIEFYPSRGQPIHMSLLEKTLPVNLFPPVFLLSNGQLFIQSNRKAALFDETGKVLKHLPDVPVVPRPYPASAGVIMLPMAPEDDYAQSLLFCGGNELGEGNWGDLDGPHVSTTDKPASNSCEMIDPLGSGQWQTVDPLEEGRSMGMFTHLPDGTLFFGGGVTMGTAGYTRLAQPIKTGKPVGQSLGDAPSYNIMIFDPRAPAGSKWKQGPTMKHERMYHSSLSLLPDGSVLIGGSNPNDDVTTAHWPTSYFLERYYPSWYNAQRPPNDKLPDHFTYGGAPFEIQLDNAPAQSAYVRFIRTGFSTHGLSWSSRSLELKSELNGNVLRVSGLPDNPNLFVPGKVLAFLVVDGVPSQGKFVWVGPKQGQRRQDGLEERGLNHQWHWNFTLLPPEIPSNRMARPEQKALHIGEGVLAHERGNTARLAQNLRAQEEEEGMQRNGEVPAAARHLTSRVRRRFFARRPR